MRKNRGDKNPKRRRVQFVFETAEALEVAVSGDFNGWDPKAHIMKNDGNGMWKKVMMLPLGLYEYKFIVDGEWKIDPHNQYQNSNCFGTCNNILEIT